MNDWAMTEAILEVLMAEMDAINETPRKEHTPQQRERLIQLRRLCILAGERRYDLLKEKK